MQLSSTYEQSMKTVQRFYVPQTQKEVNLPSSLTTDSRYLKSFTLSSRCPFTVMLLGDVWLRLLIKMLLFPSLISMPYTLVTSSSPVVSSAWLLPTRSMSSAKRRFEMDLPPMDLELRDSPSASSTMFSKKTVNKTGERRQPWRTPTVFLKSSPMLWLGRTALLAFV